MSDTHGKHERVDVPDGDILIHAGDFQKYGSRKEVAPFAEWFASLTHEWKIVISGNHDRALYFYPEYAKEFLSRGIEYLRDQTAMFPGLKIYGSPWTPPFLEWFFMQTEERLAQTFASIPEAVDVLVTHGPPAGVLDYTDLEGVPAGSQALLSRLNELVMERNRPLVHIFGHIHERHGGQDLGGNYRAYNVAICDFKYNPVNPCTVIEV